MRDIDLVLTDRNWRTVGLIERNQSIRLKGTPRAASVKQAKRGVPRIVITEEGKEENTSTDEEPIVGPSDSF